MKRWVLALALSCGSPAPPAATPPSAAAPSDVPTRDEVIAYARRYVEVTWTAQANNVFHGVDPQGVQVDTPDRDHIRGGGWSIGPNQGVPYNWGGNDSPDEFLQKIAAGAPAGYVEHSRSAPGSESAAGVDCSGLVSRSWRLSKKHGTRMLPGITIRLASMSDLLPGDILNKAGAHVMLFERFADDAKSRVAVIEAGAWDGRAWKVVASEYDVARLEAAGFVPLRDARR